MNADSITVGFIVALVGGACAGAFLRELHVGGHPERHMSGIRAFLYIGMLGLLYYLGQVIGAFALGYTPIVLIFFFGLWLTFAAAAGLSTFLLGRGRTRST